MNSHIPQKYGGLEIDNVSGCLVCEELAYACSGIQTAIEGSTLGVRKFQLVIEAKFNISYFIDYSTPDCWQP